MIGIRIDKDGLVIKIDYLYGGKGDLIVVDSIPKHPEREGYSYTLYYENGELVYHEEELPPFEPTPEPIPPKVSYNEQVEALIRKEYSVSQELAILRQQAEKPEEYQAYYDYCEECKSKAKNEL